VYLNDCIAPFVKGSPVQMEMKFIEEYHIKSNNVIHIIAEIKNLYIKDDILNQDGFLDLAKAKVAAINGLDAYAIAKNNTRFNYQRPKKFNTMK
jgi:flavin reductase (DIM6/NTAB) family NADH-FMN oxidoreductase RutF